MRVELVIDSKIVVIESIEELNKVLESVRISQSGNLISK